ncbi:MAG: L,D-transpeptidase [Actinomycetota bacterium]|nr:L,D-transpeptidase [Actinomycetota bacterium]
MAAARASLIRVYKDAAESELITQLHHPLPSGSPLVLLVRRQRGEWLEVSLPIRPNGSSGWIRAGDVDLSVHDYRITVELRRHELTVFRGTEEIVRAPIGVGTSLTPTPGGEYYTTELLQPPDPGGPYGPYAYGLSGFSETLDSFKGTDAVVGLHGTNQPDLLGTDVSHGCIRVHNDVIEELASMLPLGVPVEIRP